MRGWKVPMMHSNRGAGLYYVCFVRKSLLQGRHLVNATLMATNDIFQRRGTPKGWLGSFQDDFRYREINGGIASAVKGICRIGISFRCGRWSQLGCVVAGHSSILRRTRQKSSLLSIYGYHLRLEQPCWSVENLFGKRTESMWAA
jgi:hypothetical protein